MGNPPGIIVLYLVVLDVVTLITLPCDATLVTTAVIIIIKAAWEVAEEARDYVHQHVCVIKGGFGS